MYILLDDDKIVLEIIPDEDPIFPGVSVSDRYAPDFVARLTQVADDPSAQQGKMYLDGKFVDPSVDPSDPPETLPEYLEQAKAQRIAQSKEDLAAYLETHPLAWTDGQAYAITAEKQAQLTGKLMAATMAQSLSQPYDLTWNSTGEVCKAWTLEDLSALAFAIDARVTTLVTYQQTQEVAMRDAKDLDELNSIVVDYDTVQ